MQSSIKRNYLLNVINTFIGILYPLITFPYASRIVGVEGIGQIGFLSSIISYIGLFSSLGIPVYGIREVAKVRDNGPLMSKTTVEILIMHFMLTLLGYVAVALFCFTLPAVSNEIPLFLILSASLFLSTIGCDWFFVGNEDFLYITLRGIFVRLISAVLLFSCVHSKSDILIYAGIHVLGTTGNNILNFIRLRSVLSPFKFTFKELAVFRHLYPSFMVFALTAVISLYVNLNPLVLGLFKNNVAVGYYVGATKIAKLLLGVVGALQSAMIPRFSYLAKKETMSEFNSLCQLVVDFVVLLCIPMTIGLAVMAPALIRIICGPSFEPAILTLTIVSPIVIMIALSGIACFQILYPSGHEKEAVWSAITGAVVNLVMCVWLIPRFSYNGAAVAVLVCETVVTITMYLYGKKYIAVKYWSNHYLNCMIGGIIMFIFIFGFRMIGLGDWLNLFVIPLIGVLTYSAVLFVRKDEFFFIVLRKIGIKIVRL